MDSELEVECANLQSASSVDESRLVEGVRRVLAAEGICSGEISITVVDDVHMHELNRRHLDHDYPTDVLSFVLERSDDHLEGEIIVSADYAAREAVRYRWPAEDELLLYVVHGALHLVGCDDTNPQAAAAMRGREREILATFGITPPGRD